MSNATKWTPKVGDRIERVGSPSILPAPGTLGVVVDVKGKASNGIRARWDGSTSDVGTITNTRRSRPAEPAIGDVVRSRISERYGVVTGVECAAGMKALTVTQAGGRGRVCDAAVCDIVERPSSVDRARVIDGVAIGDRVQGRGTGRLGVVTGFAGTPVVPLLRVAFEASPTNQEHLETVSRRDVERLARDRRRTGVKVDELLTSPIVSANPAAFAVINPPVEPEFKPGDRVQTTCGARFRGTVIGVYGDEISVELDVDEHLGEWTSFHHRALEPETEPLFELGERVRLRHCDKGDGTVVGLDEYPQWTRVEWDDGHGGQNVRTTALLRSSKPKPVSSDRVELGGFAVGGSSPAQVATGNAARRCSVPDLVDDESVTHETVAGRRYEITIRRVEG